MEDNKQLLSSGKYILNETNIREVKHQCNCHAKGVKAEEIRIISAYGVPQNVLDKLTKITEGKTIEILGFGEGISRSLPKRTAHHILYRYLDEDKNPKTQKTEISKLNYITKQNPQEHIHKISDKDMKQIIDVINDAQTVTADEIHLIYKFGRPTKLLDALKEETKGRKIQILGYASKKTMDRSSSYFILYRYMDSMETE